MIKLVWRNLLRNKRRTALTLASVALALLILSLLGAVLNAFDAASGTTSARRVVVRNAISLTFSLPEAYRQRLERLDHVEAVVPLNWFQGIYKDTRPENFFPRFGTDPEQVFEVFPELQIPEDQVEAFQADRRGAVAGRSLVEQYGWEIGDTIAIQGDIFPLNLELVLRGIFEEPANPASERQLFFHDRYIEEGMGNFGEDGTFWLLLDDPDAVPEVVEAAEAMFENSENQVRAETEEAFALSFMEMMGNIQFLFGAIGLAIVVSIFLITANTMAMAARERTTEVSVLRTLGFRRAHVMGVVVGEALAIGILGSLFGALLASGVIRVVTPVMEQSGLFFGGFEVTPQMLGLAVVIGIGIGLLSGVAPAVAAARTDIVDGLRRA